MPMRIESSLTKDLDQLIHDVIGATIEVHRILGPGFLETVYETALCHELTLRGIRFEKQKDVAVPYKDILIPGQRVDLVVEGKLILELKTVDAFAPIHQAVLLSYMKASGIRAGLLINFKSTQLKSGIKRLVL
jgi:GxxExxY protein